MAMEKFRASALPVPPREYDQQYMTQLIRVLGLYFSQLDSQTPMQNESYRAGNFYGGFFHGSARYLKAPYNQFLSLTDQSATAVDEAYPVQLEETTFTDSIVIGGIDNSHIIFPHEGIYSVTYSLSFKNPNNDRETVDIWIRYNGVDYPDSNSRFTLPTRKTNNDPSYLIAVSTITGEAMAADDYIQIMWRPSSTAVVMEHLPAVSYSVGVTPDIPATPSAIVQAAFISTNI